MTITLSSKSWTYCHTRRCRLCTRVFFLYLSTDVFREEAMQTRMQGYFEIEFMEFNDTKLSRLTKLHIPVRSKDKSEANERRLEKREAAQS
jgi:hypothetical protein